jgi:hypothetical protein
MFLLIYFGNIFIKEDKNFFFFTSTKIRVKSGRWIMCFGKEDPGKGEEQRG